MKARQFFNWGERSINKQQVTYHNITTVIRDTSDNRLWHDASCKVDIIRVNHLFMVINYHSRWVGTELTLINYLINRTKSHIFIKRSFIPSSSNKNVLLFLVDPLLSMTAFEMSGASLDEEHWRELQNRQEIWHPYLLYDRKTQMIRPRSHVKDVQRRQPSFAWDLLWAIEW